MDAERIGQSTVLQTRRGPIRNHTTRCSMALLAAGLLVSGCQTIDSAAPALPDDSASVFTDGGRAPASELDSVIRSGKTRRRLAEASQLIRHGDLSLARKQLVLLLKDEPSHTVAVEMLADVCRQTGDVRLEKASLIRLIRLQPRSAAIMNRAGKQLHLLARTSPTEPAPVSSAQHPTLGDEAERVDAQELALAALERATQLEPRNGQFLQDLFGALIDSGQDYQAGYVIRRALDQNPRDRILPMVAARFYEARDDQESAAFFYDLALTNDPANRVWRRQRGMCHFRRDDYISAREDLSAALHGTPVKPQLSEYLAWGEAALHAEELEEAQRVLELIVTDGEFRTPDIEMLRGLCSLRLGNIVQAELIVLKAQVDWPGHAGLRRLARQIELASIEPGEDVRIRHDLAGLNMSLMPGHSATSLIAP